METYNLPYIASLLEQEKWIWAKTMPSIPHEYIVRGKCRMQEEDFLMIVHAQRDIGKHEVWGKYNFPYLYLNGYKYWTMGDTFKNTIILNRQKVFSEFDDLKNPTLPLHPEEMLQRIALNINNLYSNQPIFEVIQSSYALTKLLKVEPSMYRCCIPSKKMTEEFTNALPHFNGCINRCSFEECFHQWNTSKDVIIACFGAPNYIMRPYLKMLADNHRKVFLMFYKEGFCPQEFVSLHHFEYKLSEIKALFNGYQIVGFQNYIVVYKY